MLKVAIGYLNGNAFSIVSEEIKVHTMYAWCAYMSLLGYHLLAMDLIFQDETELLGWGGGGGGGGRGGKEPLS